MDDIRENFVKDLATVNDYHESGDVFWKEMDDYLIIMIEQNDKVYIEIRSGLEDGAMPAAIGEKAAVISELEKVYDCIINKASIQLSFEVQGLTSNVAEEVTHQVVELLKENHIPGDNTCQFCKQSMMVSDNAYIKVNSRFLKVHKGCYEKFVDVIEEGKNKQKGNYLTGIFGAIIFGAIGTIPWIIIGILGWLASILGMVIGISANYGYSLFRGKQGKGKAMILVITLVVMVISAGFVTQLYELFKYLRNDGIEGVSLIDGLKFIIMLLKEDSEFARSFVMNSAMGIGFGLLGSWRIIKASGEEPAINKINVELVE